MRMMTMTEAAAERRKRWANAGQFLLVFLAIIAAGWLGYVTGYEYGALDAMRGLR